MAAGLQKRQSGGACSVSGSCIQELYAEKRKINLELSRWYRRMRPHIALEWNEAQDKPVARKGQVGITWRYFSPFYEPSKYPFHRDLADVFIIPEELYELKDLKHVLSYEVWNTYLSDSERKLLSEFLPKGVDANSVLQSLFHGQNFHFGNPLITWGSSVCSGGIHPDVVCSREIDLRARKKVYHSVRGNYHKNVLKTLQRWKEIWESCKNPEFLQKVWKGSQKHGIAHVQETSVGGTTEVTISEKQEHILSDTIKRGQDGEFIKISQKHPASILKMKQTGEELQLESVDATSGDTKGIDIQPFVTLKELNKEKFAEYWMLLIERDLPRFHAKYVEGCLQRHHLRKKIEKEILEQQELFLYKARCEEKALESKCNKKEMAHYSEETSFLVTNPPGYTIAKANLVGQSDLQIAQPHSGSNIQHGSSSKSGNSSDKEELFAEHALAIDSFPVEKSNMCWSPSLDMTSETSIPQNIKSEKDGNFMLKLENPHLGVIFSPELGMRGNSGFTSDQPVSRDDSVSSVKETWSSAHFDSQEFHLHDMAGSTVKESDHFLERKRPSSWTPPKLLEETFDNDSIRGHVMRIGPEKKARFDLEKAGTSQDVVCQQIHTSPGADQLVKSQRHSFFVSPDEKGGMESYVLHLSHPLSSEKPRGELELHPFKEREVFPDTQILSLGMRDRSTQGSDLSLEKPQQPVKDDHPFKLQSQRFECQQMRNALQPHILDHLIKEVTMQNMQSDEAHSLFVSTPHDIQARKRKHSIHQEINQTGLDHSLPSEPIKGQTLHGFQHPSCLTQELQFLTDDKSTEKKSQLQKREIIQSGFNGHLQEPRIFNQNQHHENQSYLFQCSQKNQSLQHSGQQYDFPPGLTSGMVPSWSGPLQIAPCRPLPATANAQFHPQPGNNDERKLFGPLPQSDRLPQSTYGILNHIQNGITKTYPNSSSSSGNNCRGQDDWVQHQNSGSNPQYSYHPQEPGSAYRAGRIPWINITPTLYANSQIAHFRQQSCMPDFKGGEHI